jgi:hypothetical protein
LIATALDQLIGSNYVKIPDSAQTILQNATCNETSRFVDDGLESITLRLNAASRPILPPSFAKAFANFERQFR